MQTSKSNQKSKVRPHKHKPTVFSLKLFTNNATTGYQEYRKGKPYLGIKMTVDL